jgi:hypothetical protein
MDNALMNRDDKGVLDRVVKEVFLLCRKYPVYR